MTTQALSTAIRRERGRITRPDGSRVLRYAPGDGHLSFTVDDGGGRAEMYNVTDAEAEQLCPAGWTIYMDGPYHRARPLQPETLA